MTKVTNRFDLFLANIAQNQAQFWYFAKEWRSLIIVSFVAKLVTMTISILAGYYFFYAYTLAYFEQPVLAIGITVICLMVLELLTNITLAKTFKFAFHQKWLTATGCTIGALLLFTASFQVTCNGWALKEGEKTDTSTTIEATYKEKEATVKADRNAQIQDIKKQIVTIEKNPLGWSGYERTKLTNGQLEEISNLNAKLSDLRALHTSNLQELTKIKKKALAANKTQIQQEASKYYNIAAYIMLAQIAFSALLMFFWAKIHKENKDEKEALTTEVIQMRKEIKRQMWDTLQTDLTDFARQLKHLVNQPIELEVTPSNGALTGNHDAPKKQIGFAVKNTDTSTTEGVNGAVTPPLTGKKKDANYYWLNRPALCKDLLLRVEGELAVTTKELAQKHTCSEATVRNCQRAIIH